jgi:hypothetical protein
LNRKHFAILNISNSQGSGTALLEFSDSDSMFQSSPLNAPVLLRGTSGRWRNRVSGGGKSSATLSLNLLLLFLVQPNVESKAERVCINNCHLVARRLPSVMSLPKLPYGPAVL